MSKTYYTAMAATHGPIHVVGLANGRYLELTISGAHQGRALDTRCVWATRLDKQVARELFRPMRDGKAATIEITGAVSGARGGFAFATDGDMGILGKIDYVDGEQIIARSVVLPMDAAREVGKGLLALSYELTPWEDLPRPGFGVCGACERPMFDGEFGEFPAVMTEGVVNGEAPCPSCTAGDASARQLADGLEQVGALGYAAQIREAAMTGGN